MTIALLVPAALAALAALLLPILVHLVRRPQQQVLDFAALRWLASVQRPQRRVVLEERLLLAVRLALLALLALLLAQPVLHDRAAGGPLTVLVPGVDLDRTHAGVGAPDDPSRWRWLAPGFPIAGGAPPAPADTASLLRELDAALPAGVELTVLVPELLHGLDGARPALGRPVDWRVLPGSVPPPAATDADPPALALRYPAERAQAHVHLRATVAAWQLDAPDTVALDARQDHALPAAGVDTLFWLHEGALPPPVRDWMQDGRTLVVDASAERAAPDDGGVPVWRDATGTPLAVAQRAGRGRLVTLMRPLDPRTMPELLEPDFPQQLRMLLQPPAAPAAAPAETHRPIQADIASGGPGLEQSRQPLFPWLALLIALLVLVERVLATRTRRWRR